MGSSESANQNATSNLSFPFGKMHNSSFYLEKNLSYFFYTDETSAFINSLDLNRIVDIASIIISRPDKLEENEIIFLLEKIIENYDIDQQSSSKDLKDEGKINKNDISKIDDFYKKYVSISNYRKMEFTKKDNSKPIKMQYLNQSFDFLKIKNPLNSILTESLNDSSFQEIIEATNIFRSILPIQSTVAPNSNSFFQKNDDCYIFDFHDNSLSQKLINNLGPFGLSSNGQFIFVLSTLHLLFIFPILNNGALMPPRIVRLPFKEIKDDSIILTTESCVTAFPEFIKIHPYPASINKANLNINDFVSQDDFSQLNNNQIKQFNELKLDIENVKLSNSKEFLCKITNGVVYIVVSKYKEQNDSQKIGFSCDIKDIKTKKHIRKIKLCKNHQQLYNKCDLYHQWDCDPLLPDLFPDLNYCRIPIETNGTTISFIFEVQEDVAIYRTFSLITGEFLSDEKIYLSSDDNQLNHIIATNVDSVNNCRWILTTTSDNKVCLRKMQYKSSIDPYIFHIEDDLSTAQKNEFLDTLHNLLRYFCCSTCPPSFLLCQKIEDFHFLLELLKSTIQKNSNQLHIQTLCLLVSLNMINNEEFCSEQKQIFEILYCNFEIGLKFLLFFPIFSSLFKQSSDETISLLFSLFSEATRDNESNSNDLLISYALKKLEDCIEFSTFSLLKIKNFHNIIKNDSFLSLFIVHQHVLIQNVQNFLEKENLIENQMNNQSPLDTLKDYTRIIVSLFLERLHKCQISSTAKNETIKFDSKKLNEFFNDPFYKLFHNYLHLLTPLTQNHIVSQVASVFFTSLLKDYIQISDENKPLKIDLLETCYLYGLFVSTLVSGGGLNPFEEKFIWVIRSNLDLLKNDELLNNLSAKIEDIEFIEKNDTFTLNYLYSKIKQPFNKNLSEDVKILDKTVLLAISQHMNCLHELLCICNMNSNLNETEIKISPMLRQSFLQMQRIRNKYKSTPTEQKPIEYNNFIIKSHILLKLKSFTLFTNDIDSRAKILADFIISSYSPDYIKGIFLMQKNRIPTTQLGFALINDTFHKDKNQKLTSIIGHVMNKFLTNFEGLNSILCMEGSSYLSRDDLNTFFENIYPLTQCQNEKTLKTRIIPYRFFKSIKIFPDILESFLSNLLKSFDNHMNDPGFYSLVILMIKLIDNLPTDPFQQILLTLICKTNNNMNTYQLSIIENILMKINDDFVISDEFIEIFFNDSLLKSPIDIKIVMRIRYLLINILMNDSLDRYLKDYLFFIGDHLNDSNKYYSFLVTEIITLLRKVYLKMLQDESSPMRNNSIYLLLMNSISNRNNYNEKVALSLCAIFGFQMEAINPYSVVKICLNEDSNSSFLLIKNNFNDIDFDTDECSCYSLPFDINNEPHEFKSLKMNSFITVVPEVTYTNVIFADKLKNMLITSSESSKKYKIFPVCAQALLTFYSINPEIITSKDQKLIDFMCTKICHFNDIYQTFNRIKSFHSILNGKSKKNNIQILQDISFEFGQLQDNSSSTYLSFPLLKNAPVFLVNIEIIDNDNIISNSEFDLINFGVVSDSLEEEEIRISTVGFPSGLSFPENKKVEFLDVKKISNPDSNKVSYNVSFIVNIKNKKFSVNSNEVDFPIGRQFCLIIFTKKKYNLTFKPTFSVENQMEASSLIFDYESHPDLDKIISVKRKQNNEFEDFNFLEFPEFLKNMNFNPNEKVLKEDFHQYPKIDKYSHEMELNKKLRLMPFLHPMNPVLHINKALGISAQLIEHHLKGLYLKLGRQWITVLLMKITINNASLVTDFAFDLFSTFSIPLESFNQEEFNQNRFPFSLENPPWKTSTNSSSLIDNKKPSFYFLATNDLINALSSLIKNNDCMDQIARGLLLMSSSNNLHQIALPHKYLVFNKFSKITLNRQSIISFNNYKGLQKNAAFIFESMNHKIYYDFPFIFKLNNDSDLSMTQLNIVNNDLPISILEVNTVNSSLKNHWVIDTPIELLIHLKNFALAAKNEYHHALVKTILLDLYLGKSPFVIPYIDQFQEFSQMKCSASLFYRDPIYMKHLIALACFLNSMENKPDERYVFLYESEQRLMASDFTIYDAAHFPEFFHSKTRVLLPKPTTNTISIPYEPIDPGSINEGFQSKILMIKLFFQKQDSIVGCQFWEILPLWNRIVECFGFDNDNLNNENEESNFSPSLTKVDTNIVKISNPTKNEFSVRLKFKRRMLTSELRNLTFQYSKLPNFEDATFVQFCDFDKPIKIIKGDTFFSILSDSSRDPWGNLCDLQIESTNKRKNINNDNNKNRLITITEEYKKEFIQSMKTFILNWTQENTESLLNMFELDQLKSPSFETISQIVLESDLSKIFPKTVILLRSLLIHQFSYIRYNHHERVSEFLWNSCANLVPILEKCTILRQAIKTNDKKLILGIDRQAAISLINDYNKNSELNSKNNRSQQLCLVENRNNSIISQFAREIQENTMDNLRGIKPFSVRFLNEKGVDCGGPTKDFLNEASSSIFEPSSQLFMKANCDEEFFIPETRKRSTKISEKTIKNEYFAVGVLIAIICRTGYPQYLPFAPFIYKYIANEIITADDIAEVDKDFEIELRNIKEKQIRPDWKATTWTSSERVSLQNRILIKNDENDDEEEDDETERYLNEFTKFRLNLLKPILKEIRDGFVTNASINSHPMLNGKVLSFLAQGSPDITTAQLKEITKVFGFGNDLDEAVEIFWSVVDEFTVEQRRLLLKFITGVTRIPKIKSNDVAPFYITIQQFQTGGALDNTNDKLPASATCFNKLYLPKYTNKESAKSKILYAIQNCLTMEQA